MLSNIESSVQAWSERDNEEGGDTSSKANVASPIVNGQGARMVSRTSPRCVTDVIANDVADAVSDVVQTDLLNCRRCPRLRHYLKQLRNQYPDYWNRPVAASGPKDAPLQIIGLAPGLHGANRTGMPFKGDASGDLLWRVLSQLGIEDQVRTTNVVKCLPRNNLPLASEVRRCQRFLVPELSAMPMTSVILALGGVAHKAIVQALDARQVDYPFGHSRCHQIGEWYVVDSYHCSRYNTQTGRLTETMFRDVVELAYQLATDQPQ